jgi:5-methylcytosine-specific restriction enzyme subunit McrC
LVLDEIVKRQTLQRGQVVCTFDELVLDVLHNRILKATLRVLASADDLDKQYRHELRLLVRRLEGVREIRLDSGCFRRVQLSRNTRQYRLLLQICELTFYSLLPDEVGSGSRFADILKDEVRLSAVFEEFLKNFYSHEQDDYQVGSDVLAWDAKALTTDGMAYLPAMRTDITLRSSQRIIVADAKYYTNTLAHFHGSSKIHSANLYQLYTYLQHMSGKHPGVQTDGLLIYPTVKVSLMLDYELPQHRIRVATVDLSLSWPEIHEELLQILSKHVEGPRALITA